LTKRTKFTQKIRRIWYDEGFKVIDMCLRPVDGGHLEWRIVAERIKLVVKGEK